MNDLPIEMIQYELLHKFDVKESDDGVNKLNFFSFYLVLGPSINNRNEIERSCFFLVENDPPQIHLPLDGNGSFAR